MTIYPVACGRGAGSQSLRRRADVPMPHEQGAWAPFRSEWGGLCMRRRQTHEQGPVACGAAVPPAKAFGAVQTCRCPTSRGHGCFVSFRMGRFAYATATGPRAGACRLRRLGEEKERTANALCRASAVQKNYPASAVRRCFFTRRSGRAETCGRLCLPRAIRDRGHGIHGNRPGILF